MKLIAPDWYPLFRCRAGQCSYTCCAGWEIDIDPETMERYQSMPGALGELLRAGIEPDGTGGGSFRLQGEDERCPMLRPDGLCELICRCGEDVLCGICADHPRFRNYYADRTELGLGLCCEAVTDLVLRREPPMTLIELADDGAYEEADPGEASLLDLRERLLDIARDRTRPLETRLCTLLETAHLTLPGPSFWRKPLLALERLEPAWTERLMTLQGDAWPAVPAALDRPAEQLLCCLLYRHIPGAMEEGLLREHIALCVLLLRLMLTLSPRMEDLPETVRLCSA